MKEKGEPYYDGEASVLAAAEGDEGGRAPRKKVPFLCSFPGAFLFSSKAWKPIERQGIADGDGNVVMY